MAPESAGTSTPRPCPVIIKASSAPSDPRLSAALVNTTRRNARSLTVSSVKTHAGLEKRCSQRVRTPAEKRNQSTERIRIK
ncbi:Hypothetical predicted protein [Xyrichtys novacula]|uniref:Uncharacterized protein n=1 Tax=Xyrichtys novacula TaxID=13765 RepID=A0AAV1H998_XYRNO|nr:Hypothetical predicted protein [Xyrichtys novacula]